MQRGEKEFGGPSAYAPAVVSMSTADWTTVAALATALGTLVLAIATFASVRSSNRSIRLAEASMQIGIRPLLMPSRPEDTTQTILWGDEHRAQLEGAAAVVEAEGTTSTWRCRCATPGRDRGDTGVAPRVARRRCRPSPCRARGVPAPTARPLHRQRRHGVLAGSAPRPGRRRVRRGRADRELPRRFLVELLYTDHEGGQRTIGQFVVGPREDGGWMCSMVRHWYLDRPDPR